MVQEEWATPGSPNSIATSLITNLINSLTGTGSPVHGGITATELTNSGVMPTSVNDFLSNQPPPGSSKPKAYINWVLLYEQFKFVQSGSGAEQVGDDQVLLDYLEQNQRNGRYLIIKEVGYTPGVGAAASSSYNNIQFFFPQGKLFREIDFSGH